MKWLIKKNMQSQDTYTKKFESEFLINKKKLCDKFGTMQVKVGLIKYWIHKLSAHDVLNSINLIL